MKYSFLNIDKCSFCGSSEFKILGRRLNTSQGKNPRKKTGITTTIVRCVCCGLIFPNPFPIPENISDHYNISPEEYWPNEYFTIPDNHLKNYIEWMNNIRKFDSDSKILDIGAGIGKNMIALKRYGYDAYGIEPSLPFYDRAISKMGIDPDKLQLVSIENCIFQDNMFDAIFFSAVLEHLYNPAEILKKIINWVKPNGLVFIESPSASWLINKLVNKYYKIRGSDYVTNLSPMHPPYHLYEFTKKAFELHAEMNNYEVVDCRYFVCQTYAPKIFDKILKKYMKMTNTGMELAIWLRKK
ncbi:MAG TPA: class I SAM-dependent methyltransferase [Bacteroidales bacterium]|nr:class I SAM-dependent methyltransferase [Bacteroidales bacterium]HPS15945.1 class I SAM-dependent methyltransferase [Bacteroidales bacterium]